MINAQKELLKAGGSILALAGTMARLKSKLNEKASDNAKKGYEKAANIKKENKELTKKNIEQVIEKKVPQSFGELARDEEEIPTEAVKAKSELEKAVVENKKQVKGFEGLPEEAAPKQKYILSEEGAYFPIKAENTETKIPVDEDVQGLIKAKQKNALRAAAGRKSQIAYRASKGYENDFPIRDYLPNVEDKELYKAGITKTELNNLSSILAGNGTEEDIQNWFKKHNASDMPVINMDSLTVSEDTAKEIKRLILDKDINLEEEQSKSSEWYDNFTRETNTYKVWEDQESSEDLQETDRSFSGIVF